MNIEIPNDGELARILTDQILADILNSTHEQLLVDDDLLEDGMLDSLGIMRLIAFIESKFGFAVPAEDVIVENFMTVQAIIDYLKPNLAVDGQ